MKNKMFLLPIFIIISIFSIYNFKIKTKALESENDIIYVGSDFYEDYNDFNKSSDGDSNFVYLQKYNQLYLNSNKAYIFDEDINLYSANLNFFENNLENIIFKETDQITYSYIEFNLHTVASKDMWHYFYLKLYLNDYYILIEYNLYFLEDGSVTYQYNEPQYFIQNNIPIADYIYLNSYLSYIKKNSYLSFDDFNEYPTSYTYTLSFNFDCTNSPIFNFTKLEYSDYIDNKDNFSFLINNENLYDFNKFNYLSPLNKDSNFLKIRENINTNVNNINLNNVYYDELSSNLYDYFIPFYINNQIYFIALPHNIQDELSDIYFDNNYFIYGTLSYINNDIFKELVDPSERSFYEIVNTPSGYSYLEFVDYYNYIIPYDDNSILCNLFNTFYNTNGTSIYLSRYYYNDFSNLPYITHINDLNIPSNLNIQNLIYCFLYENLNNFELNYILNSNDLSIQIEFLDFEYDDFYIDYFDNLNEFVDYIEFELKINYLDLKYIYNYQLLDVINDINFTNELIYDDYTDEYFIHSNPTDNCIEIPRSLIDIIDYEHFITSNFFYVSENLTNYCYYDFDCDYILYSDYISNIDLTELDEYPNHSIKIMFDDYRGIYNEFYIDIKVIDDISPNIYFKDDIDIHLYNYQLDDSLECFDFYIYSHDFKENPLNCLISCLDSRDKELYTSCNLSVVNEYSYPNVILDDNSYRYMICSTDKNNNETYLDFNVHFLEKEDLSLIIYLSDEDYLNNNIYYSNTYDENSINNISIPIAFKDGYIFKGYKYVGNDDIWCMSIGEFQLDENHDTKLIAVFERIPNNNLDITSIVNDIKSNDMLKLALYISLAFLGILLIKKILR